MSDEGSASPAPVWAPPASVWAPPAAPGEATPVRRRGAGQRRNAVLAGLAALLVAGTVVGILAAVGPSSPGNPFAGESAAQILRQSLAAAHRAGSFRVDASGPATGLPIQMTLDLGARGASGQGSAGDGTLRIVITPANTYIEANAAYYVRSSGLPASAISRLAGRWVSLGAGGFFGTGAHGSTSASFLDAYLALSGPLKIVRGSETGGTVAITGEIPAATQSASGSAATLTVSATPPYYPVALAFKAATVGQSRFVFSHWGETVHVSAPTDAVPLVPSVPASGVLPTESDLQTALTGAKTYYTENNQTYDGFGPAAFAALDTGLTAVPASTPSTGARRVSLFGRAAIAVLAAWSSSPSACLAIVDNTGSGTLAGTPGPATTYIEAPGIPQSRCDAATFDAPHAPAGATASTDGFPQG